MVIFHSAFKINHIRKLRHKMCNEFQNVMIRSNRSSYSKDMKAMKLRMSCVQTLMGRPPTFLSPSLFAQKSSSHPHLPGKTAVVVAEPRPGTKLGKVIDRNPHSNNLTPD